MVDTAKWDHSGLDVIIETCFYLKQGGINLLPNKHIRVWHVVRAAQKIASNPKLLKAIPHRVRVYAPEWGIDYTLTRGDIIKAFWEAYRKKSLR